MLPRKYTFPRGYMTIEARNFKKYVLPQKNFGAQ
jgi:hypothetical protein